MVALEAKPLLPKRSKVCAAHQAVRVIARIFLCSQSGNEKLFSDQAITGCPCFVWPVFPPLQGVGRSAAASVPRQNGRYAWFHLRYPFVQRSRPEKGRFECDPAGQKLLSSSECQGEVRSPARRPLCRWCPLIFCLPPDRPGRGGWQRQPLSCRLPQLLPDERRYRCPLPDH